jgi:hypothetical protein
MKEFRICPKCGSIEVKRDYHYGMSFIANLPITFKCKKCKHVSEFFPLVEKKDIEKFRKKLKK